ncbi:MAG: TetR family transcriptional regulator [Terracidiphilus sp.]
MSRSQKNGSAALAGAMADGGLTHPPNAGRRERRAVETRVRLFRCALQLIAERGLLNVTVEDITEAADVGKGTFFNYFPTKDHVLGVMAEIQLGKVKEAVSVTGQGKQAIHSVLHQLMLRLAEEPGRSPDLARALISSLLASKSVREIIVGKMLEGHKMIAKVVVAGQKRGEIDPRLQKEKLATHFMQAVMGTILLWSTHGEPALNAWMEDSFRHFWRSIAISGRE